jgi:hypothetical protein
MVCFKAENKFKPKMYKVSILMHFKFEYVCVCEILVSIVTKATP